MQFSLLGGRRRRFVVLGIGLAAATAAAAAFAAVPLTQISSDPFTNPTSQHKTQVEPDTFSYGSTIVSAFQSGRFFNGGSSDTGWATSKDGGTTWTQGFLPLTTFMGGTYGRASDPAVAYDPKHNVWLISSLAFSPGDDVVVNRSLDGGLTWQNPVTVTSGGGNDKNWIACDTTPSSPFYGNCYTEWDRNGQGNAIEMSTSTDGGVTWGPAKAPADNASGLGGQPIVDKTGQVIVPITANFGSVIYFTSKDGGASWSATKLVSSISDHTVAGGLRTLPLPSAEIDKKGTVYMVWQDCRFRGGCSSNDLVMATIKKGTKVSSVVRIPIDPVSSTVDHFIPGLAVDRSTSGKHAHLALTYYYYPTAACSQATCQLDVGYVSSSDGGKTWSAPLQLAGPMNLTWLPDTTLGRMVGDYISTSYVNGKAFPVFAVANAPNGSVFDEAMYAPTNGLAAQLGVSVAGTDKPVPNAHSDHPLPSEPPAVH